MLMKPEKALTRVKMCRVKKKYVSEATALFIRGRVGLKGDISRLHPYQCPVRHFWHLGNSKS